MARSLRRRLTLTVISIFLISWIVSAFLTTVAARFVLESEVDKLLSSMLEVTVKIGQTLQQGELEALQSTFSERMVAVDASRSLGDGSWEDPTPVRFDEDFDLGALGSPALNIWVGGIHLLVGQSTPLFAHPDQVETGGVGEQVIEGQPWRIKYRYDDVHNVWYAAGLVNRGAPFDAGGLLLQMLQPLALIIPITVLALYFGIHNNLRPLRSLSRLIEERRGSQGLEPISAPSAPQEMVPVVESLNHLLERLADTLENEKRFTANAAHELQTPLAAVMTEVQLCQRLLHDEASREMMARIYARVQRASHSVKQLLTLARLDPQATLEEETVSLREILETAVSELGHRLGERDLHLQFEVQGEPEVTGNRESLLILFRNLISNAFRYTPAGGAVVIEGGERRVVIANDSPPVSAPERLTDRFYRGESGAELAGEAGTGLGLSIASRICELHGAELTLDYDAEVGRFRAAVRF